MEALLDKAIKQTAAIGQDIVSLRSDVNRIHELNSTTARPLARIEQALAVRRYIKDAMQVGNIHEEDEKITFFIDVLRPQTMTLVARFRENQYREDLTFERLIQFAKDAGDSFRSMAPPLRTTRPSAGKPKPRAGIL